MAGIIGALGVLSGGCGTAIQQGSTLPQFHAIDYSATLTTTDDDEGADAFGHMLDHPESRYYVMNDFYNMESDETLHIISKFETYQQTTEYTCGCAAAIMTLNHFGENAYDEMQIAQLAGTHNTMGTSVEGLRDFFLGIGYQVDYHADTEYRFDTIESCEEYFLLPVVRYTAYSVYSTQSQRSQDMLPQRAAHREPPSQHMVLPSTY